MGITLGNISTVLGVAGFLLAGCDNEEEAPTQERDQERAWRFEQ